MSTAAVVVAPAVAPAVATGILATATVVAGAAGAVITIYAATKAVDGAVRAVGRYGARVEQEAKTQLAAEADAVGWEHALADVVYLNARLRMLTRRATSVQPPLIVPSPLKVNGRKRADIDAWLQKTQLELSEAQRALDERQATTTDSPAMGNEVAAALAAHQVVLRDRYLVTTEPVTKPGGDDVAKVLATLDPDADADELATVRAAAAEVAKAKPAMRSGHRSTLIQLVKKINDTVARRRLAAQWLVALEDHSVTDVPDTPPYDDTMTRLSAVVAGTADLDDGLRVDAGKLLAKAEAAAQQNFLLELVRKSLTAQGYELSESTVDDLVCLRLSRSDWQDEHTADVDVSRTGEINARLVREYSAVGDDAAKRDKARCATLAASVKQLTEQLETTDTTVQTTVHETPPQVRTTKTVAAPGVVRTPPKYMEVPK